MSYGQLELGELIAALEQADQEAIVPVGFTNPHSYRGYYNELAFEPAANVRVADMLAAAREALGSTYSGYKGGDYTMDQYSPTWLSHIGEGHAETIGVVLLSYMLGKPDMPSPQW